jgi:hypothetical protein
MRRSEREAYRKKHSEWGYSGSCVSCHGTFPCDASKLLDALDEAVNNADIEWRIRQEQL